MKICRFYHRFAVALSFLTIFRLPKTSSFRLQPADFAGAFPFFPVVGLIIGLLVAGLVALIHSMLPYLVTAFWIVSFMTVITRGLHLDGLADCADGIGGGYNPHQRLEIMKDSSVGSFGSLAMVLDIVLKGVALQALVKRLAFGDLIIVPIFARCSIVLCAIGMPYARREGGLGQPFLKYIRLWHLLVALIVTLVLATSLTGFRSFYYLVVTLIVVLSVRVGAIHWLGGVTGDVLGATSELSEIFLYSVAAAFFSP